MAARYAIYFVPGADSALYRLGAAVLGYDCYGGADLAPPSALDAATWPAFVREPVVYGFHATLKAPFYLAEGVREGALVEAVHEFAARRFPVNVGDLAVREIGNFVALVPAVPCAALDDLAATCVAHFDRFRGPLAANDRARRLTSPLTPRQIAHLDRWGYPYVFDDFRFHMTLTGSLSDTDRQKALPLLRDIFSHARKEFVVDRLVIARQQSGARFRIIHPAPLSAAS
jgi:putative phosphonate metabolism protein